jgi:hypothetical protein
MSNSREEKIVGGFDPFETHLIEALLLGLTQALVRCLTVLAMLAMTLRGSKPSERPVLLDSLAECLRCAGLDPLRMRRRQLSADSSRK